MADILALGITHYPPLAGHDQHMANLLKAMLKNPNLPAHLRTPDGWPAAMREEWGSDEGTQAARLHRDELVTSMRKMREEIDAFNPDFVLIWGDDQYENFKEDVIPPYCICAYDSYEYRHIQSNNVWSESGDQTFQAAGVPQAAKALASALISRGFDTAYSYKPLHRSLGHAFSNAIFYLDYDRTGFKYPILPVTINCYGRHVIAQKGGMPKFDQVLDERDLDPPAPTPQRLFDLGAETVRYLQNSPWRVAVVASSGWSHAFLTQKNHYLYPDTAADRHLFEALKNGEYEKWREYSASKIEGSGQQEVLNWMCLAGALDALGRKPDDIEMIETWIFNSSKVFMTSRP